MLAPRELVPIVLSMLRPSSVLDVGCGTGTWLKAFEEAGIDDYLGIDGDYVEASMLKIPDSKFQPFDITNPIFLHRKFDLVLSLEVAEHLPPESAEVIVESLVRHGEKILFSAAIPGQGGQNHLNEQWPHYWQEKFRKHGYYFHDVIRPIIWNNKNIEWWYRQNIFLITREEPPADLVEYVDKSLYQKKIDFYEERIHDIVEGRCGVVQGLKIFCKALRASIFGRG